MKLKSLLKKYKNEWKEQEKKLFFKFAEGQSIATRHDGVAHERKKKELSFELSCGWGDKAHFSCGFEVVFI